VQLQGSGADVFFNVTTPKFAAQAIRKAYDIGWRPVQYLVNISASIGSVLIPAGLEKSVGLISSAYLKDASDKQWDNDPGMLAWRAFMKKYYPEGDIIDGANVYGYAVVSTLMQVLKQCGDDLTRENVMKQAANLKNLRVDVLLPGILINTSATDFAPLESLQLARFNGRQWVLSGEVMGR
jgi:branched-chain amino acid transport system substrate-binding protein